MSAKSEFMKEWMRELESKRASKMTVPAGEGEGAPPRAEASRAPGAPVPESASPPAPEAARDLIGVPQLGAFADMDYFYLLAPLAWRPAPGGGGLRAVEVPRGFVTDLASVPGFFWSIASPQGRHGVAAIIHDWLYWHQDRTRDEADAIFDRIMQDLGVPRVKRLAFYYAVRWRAAGYWEEYRRAKEQGTLEKRILKRFPEQAITTWAEWRKSDEHFAT